MVLESILSPITAEDKRYRLIALGFLFCLVAAGLSFMVWESYVSLLMVFLTAMAAIPLIYNIIKYEEEKDLQDLEEKILLKEHWKALSAFMYLFLGIIFAVTVMYSILPWDTVTHMFSVQTETLQGISGSVTGMTLMKQIHTLGVVFFNNIKVLIFSILFSFIFGAGAIFVLTWNGFIIGTAIGNFIRSNLALYSDLIGFNAAAKYFHVISLGLLRYSIHGIPEILAYFTAALAGGIISVAVIRHDLGTAKFEHIILDSADLLLLSVGLLALAALLEVFITPIVFPI